MYVCIILHVWCTTCVYTYHIAGNIGEVFNLVIGEFSEIFNENPLIFCIGHKYKVHV